jgi:hypothetical protein
MNAQIVRMWLFWARWSMPFCLAACGTENDCDDLSELQITLSDSIGPIMGTVDWVADNGESGTVDCPGACVVAPSEEVSVVLTATPMDAALGDPQEEEVFFNMADGAAKDEDCPGPVYTKVDFVF